MRVLFVTHAPRDHRTAVYGYLQRRASALERAGHTTAILAPADLPWVASLPPGYRPLLYPVAVRNRVSRGGFDLAVFHSWSGWAFNLTRDRRRRPKSLTQFHGVEPLYYKRVGPELERLGRGLSLRHRMTQEWLMPLLLKLSCRRSDAVACLNNEELRFLVAEGYAPAERACLLPNSVDPAFFEGPAARGDGRRVTFVGQWLEAKGVGPLAEAWGALARARPALELCCLGTRAPRADVVSRLPGELRPRVEVQPDVDAQTIRSALAGTDVFVLPSFSEGSSLALLEAMAAGCAIVTTPVGAAPDMLRDGESALLVTPGDASALAAALARLLDDPALARRLGAAARTAARAFDWRFMQADYVRFMERLGA
jgi:glycosyltransferase involved in cell wall biosynthesis